MDDDPSLSGRVKVLFVCALFFLSFICVLSIQPEPGVNAAVISGNFKPSVGRSGFAYKWHYRSWENYCPGCKRHNTLTMNPKKVPERELTCRRCDADFCGVTGLDKAHKRRWRLTPAGVNVSNKASTVNNANTVKIAPAKYVVKRRYTHTYRKEYKVRTVWTYKVYNKRSWKLQHKRVYYWSRYRRQWRRV